MYYQKNSQFSPSYPPYTYCSVQLLSRIQLFVTPWTAAHQVSLSITNSQIFLVPEAKTLAETRLFVFTRWYYLSPLAKAFTTEANSS